MPLVSRFLVEGLLGALLYIRPEWRERGEVCEGPPGEVDPCELVSSTLAHDNEERAGVAEGGPEDRLHVGQHLRVLSAASVGDGQRLMVLPVELRVAAGVGRHHPVKEPGDRGWSLVRLARLGEGPLVQDNLVVGGEELADGLVPLVEKDEVVSCGGGVDRAAAEGETAGLSRGLLDDRGDEVVRAADRGEGAERLWRT
jgi:hypothetical protein